jgi:hypothetical protein
MNKASQIQMPGLGWEKKWKSWVSLSPIFWVMSSDHQLFSSEKCFPITLKLFGIKPNDKTIGTSREMWKVGQDTIEPKVTISAWTQSEYWELRYKAEQVSVKQTNEDYLIKFKYL